MRNLLDRKFTYHNGSCKYKTTNKQQPPQCSYTLHLVRITQRNIIVLFVRDCLSMLFLWQFRTQFASKWKLLDKVYYAKQNIHTHSLICWNNNGIWIRSIERHNITLFGQKFTISFIFIICCCFPVSTSGAPCI